MSEAGQVLQRSRWFVLGKLRSHDCRSESGVRHVYLVQVAVENSAKTTVALSTRLTPGWTGLRLSPQPVSQRMALKTGAEIKVNKDD